MRGKLSRLLAFALTLAMCMSLATTAYAYPGSSRGSSGGNNRPGSSSSQESSADSSTDSSSSAGSETTLALVEDETTVDNSDVVLRASTYEATTVDEDGSTETSTVKYFPVTMFNYDMSTFNEAVAALEDEASTTATGIYLNSGSASGGSYSITGYSVGYTSVNNSSSGPSTLNNSNVSNATKWTITAVDGGYTISSNGYYLTWGGGNSADAMGTTDEVTLSIADASYTNNNTTYTGVTIGLTTSATYKYLNAYGSNGDTFGGYNVDGSSDIGSLFYIYKQSTGISGNNTWTKVAVSDITSGGTYVIISARKGYALTLSSTETTITGSRSLASYNQWTGYLSNMDTDASAVAGNQVYQGLVASTLDNSGNIVFNYPDAGLFTTTSVEGKSVYTNVGLPFEYDSTTRQYTFNAKEMGAWFEGDAASDTNLYYSAYPQGISGSGAEDDTAAFWFPFNDSTDSTLTTLTKSGGTDVEGYNVSSPDYFFGMTASIDFTMTEDGKITYKDENGADVTEDITFHFSGDDDVWVFIDGVLVLDMGGIHNRIDGNIDFASGEWTINQTYQSTDLAVDYATGSTDGSSGNLWNTDSSTGTLDTTLATFAAQETHTLTVYYLERGAGASNCEITFNLPMKDYVTVTKEADTDSHGGALTENEQEVVDNMEFTFTIYNNGEEYANETYTVLNAATGNTIRTASTDASGQFTLHPGETARFTTMFDENSGETWYVEESDPGSAFDSTVWTTSDSAVYEVTKTTSEDSLTSDTLTVQGSSEASSTINFVCNNILDATLANPGIVPSDDRIVIDYGLSVEIDVKSNDLYRADNYKIVAINGSLTYDDGGNVTGYTDSGTKDSDGNYVGTFGTITIKNAENGQLTYQLTSQLTDVEVITYVVEVSSTVIKNEATGETDTASAYAMATVYVIPATSMYYEENFVDADGETMITYSSGSWTTEGEAESDAQEPGVVGTVGDSPYGSDAAYLADTGDSNGSSMKVSTSGSSASFTYTFTGTGTSFFARTTDDSAYLRVQVYEGTSASGTAIYTTYRNTKYINSNSETLYNIPVFTWDAVDNGLDYGTYTVKVTLAKAATGSSTSASYGSEFYLDGIRVQNPMDEESDNYSIAQSAYSADGEANVNIATLRDKVIDASGYDDDGNLTWEDGYVVLTDVEKNIVSASDYESIGPKEEVYLAGMDYSGATNAQTISFTLEGWDMNYSLYLGLKNPTGTGATVTINGHTLTVSNTADCYYSISSYLTVDNTNSDGTVDVSVTITCTAGLVSVTNIKSTGTFQFAIIQGGDEDGDGDVDADEIVDETEVTEETEAVVEETEVAEVSEAAEETEVVEETKAAEETEVAEEAEVAEATEEAEAIEDAEAAEETETVEADETAETEDNVQEASVDEAPVED
ncbi:MAG: hypothetical protein LUC30_07420 [Clostridiales bacterium]|nr:hypothetical protein [Clostridiales bacterium]